MKTKCLTLLLGLFLPFFAMAQLSSQAKVALITCGQGEAFYETFGHTALRIVDDSLGIDYVFNYGTFDFSDNHFYLNFALGKLPYMLSVNYSDAFFSEYEYYGRSVVEQELNMTLAQKQNLYRLLQNNYLPENRFYAYDFFLDNCATRVRDILEAAIGSPVFGRHQLSQKVTFRDLYHQYSNNMLWWSLGVDVVLGARADQILDTWQCLYIPFDVENQADTTNLTANNTALVADKTVIVPQTYRQEPSVVSPNLVFYLLFSLVLILTILELLLGRYFKVVDFVLMLALFLLCLVILFLCFFSNHYFTKVNFNILWANPLSLIVLLRLKKTPTWVLWTFLACILVSFGSFGLLPQAANSAFLPILFTIALRLLAMLNNKYKWVKIKKTVQTSHTK